MNNLDLTGQKIGQYELRKLLGEGGMGVVYRAWDDNLEREVAFKVLLSGFEIRDEYVRRFKREAKTAASLEHPHIVPIYDYGTHELGSLKISYVVMRLLTGGSLSDRLRRSYEQGEAFPAPTEIAEIINHIANALDYAHSRGIVHRDIKPSNVMLDGRGTPFIVDFGIAKLQDATKLTMSNNIMGTPPYMAPELWMNEDIVAATDQYALGVMAYEMLSGHFPFVAQTQFQFAHKHLHETPTSILKYRPDLPAGVDQVLLRTLAKSPAERYPTVLDFVRDFALALKDFFHQPVYPAFDPSDQEDKETPPLSPPITPTARPLPPMPDVATELVDDSSLKVTAKSSTTASRGRLVAIIAFLAVIALSVVGLVINNLSQNSTTQTQTAQAAAALLTESITQTPDSPLILTDTPTDESTEADTPTLTPTEQPTETDTSTPTFTASPTATFTYTPSVTPTPTITPFPSLGMDILIPASRPIVTNSQVSTDLTMVIGWELEPDLPVPVSGLSPSSYLSYFYTRDVWDWNSDRRVYPVMVEEVPTFENGLVTTVPVRGDFDGDGTSEDAEAPVVTYRLLEGMLWSDGEPITAADCMFWHNLMMQPSPVDSVNRGSYPNVVASADQLDDYTIRLTYNQPYPDYLSDARLACNLPAHKFLGDNSRGFTMDTDGDGVFDANFNDSPYAQGFDEIVGYGPYVISEYHQGINMVLEYNPNWGVNAWEQVPFIDTLILQFITDAQQMQNAVEVGDLDLSFNWEVTTSNYHDMRNVTTFATSGVFTDALWMNSGPNAFPAMQDVRVREAIIYAIDRRELAERFAGQGTGDMLTRSWFPEQFVPPDLPFREYDTDLARTLLAEAGWIDDDGDESSDNANPTVRVSSGIPGVPDGTELILRFYTTPVLPRPDIQVTIQAELVKVGIQIQVFVVSGPAALFAPFEERGILYTGAYDLALYALSNFMVSPTGISTFRCSDIPSDANPNGINGTWFCDSEYDRLDVLVDITNDPFQRLAYHYELEPIFYNAAVWHAVRPRPTWFAVRDDRFNVDSMRDMGTLQANWFHNVEYWEPAS